VRYLRDAVGRQRLPATSAALANFLALGKRFRQCGCAMRSLPALPRGGSAVPLKLDTFGPTCAALISRLHAHALRWAYRRRAYRRGSGGAAGAAT
jgi:hypothetical protein